MQNEMSPHRSNLNWLLGALAALGCARAEALQEEEAVPNSAKGPPLALEGPKWTRAPRVLRPSEEENQNDPALRRAYGPEDMKLGECTQHRPDGTIIGQRCPNGHVVFGPYVSTPRDADVRVTFELRALTKLEFASDVVSSAVRSLGILEAQTLSPGETRKLAYQIHVSEPITSLEARVWISSPSVAAFEIRNLTVSVQ